jgi:hypothetical protein
MSNELLVDMDEAGQTEQAEQPEQQVRCRSPRCEEPGSNCTLNVSNPACQRNLPRFKRWRPLQEDVFLGLVLNTFETEFQAALRVSPEGTACATRAMPPLAAAH